MRTWSSAVVDWFGSEPRQRHGVRAFQIVIAVVMLYRFFSEVAYSDYLLGAHGLPAAQGSNSALFAIPPSVLWGGIVVGALALLFGVCVRIGTLVLLVAFSLLNQRLPEVADGGDNLILLVLIYMLFLQPPGSLAPAGSLRAWGHNVAVAAIGAQICVLYLRAGLAKASGEPWYQGVALYTIGQVEWVSLPALRGALKNPFVATLACYVTILHQIWFPIAVLSKLRMIWIVTGIAFHIGIGAFMGLLTFSATMIGAELFLIDDRNFQAIHAHVQARLGKLHAALLRLRPS